MQDIDAHLRGGIPNRDIDALERYWQVFPGVRATLFKKADRPGYSQLKMDNGQRTTKVAPPAALSIVNSPLSIKETIFGHAEFTAFNQSVTALFAKWKKANTPRLKGIAMGGKPKALIETLSENLLETFRKARLLDSYDVYQHLMDYWAETMQDDVYMIVSDGWKAVLDGKPNTDLIPQPLIVRRYFAAEQAAIEKLEADRDTITRQMEELDEEHGGEDGLLAEAKTDKGKLTKASVKARLEELTKDNGQLTGEADEVGVAREYLALIEKESAANKKVKQSQKDLDDKVAPSTAS